MSLPNETNDDIIDLTDESYSPPRPTFLRINELRQDHGLRPAQDIINLDDVEYVGGSRDNASPDIEHLYTRQRSSTASVHASAPDPERPTSRPRMAETPPISVRQNTVHIGPWSRLAQHISTIRAFPGTRRIVPNTQPRSIPNLTFHVNTPDHGPLEAMGGLGPLGFRVPEMNFEATAFPVGRDRPQRSLSTYSPPPEPRTGFTRCPTEDATLVCPNCGEELGAGEDDLKRQVWVVKSCGHVSLMVFGIWQKFLNSYRCIVANVQSKERKKHPRPPVLQTSGLSQGVSSMDAARQKSPGSERWFSCIFEKAQLSFLEILPT